MKSANLIAKPSTMMTRRTPKIDPNIPKPLLVRPEVLAETGMQYGDIITVGRPGDPARDWRTGIPLPVEQKWIITKC